jgi:hypothetical protein
MLSQAATKYIYWKSGGLFAISDISLPQDLLYHTSKHSISLNMEMISITQEACSKMRPTTLLLLILMIFLASTIDFIVVVLNLHADGYSYTSALERVTTEDLSLLLIRTCIPHVITSLVPHPLLTQWQITQHIWASSHPPLAHGRQLLLLWSSK